jgi:hypothetical protein
VLICRLVGGKTTYVHRRLWPGLVRLAQEIGPSRLDAIREEHTKSGAHKLVTVVFPQWVPAAVAKKAQKMSERQARESLGEWLTLEIRESPPTKASVCTGGHGKRRLPPTRS